VVNEGGTGVRAKIPGVDVCGKTGSAQVASAEYERAHKDVKDNCLVRRVRALLQPGDRGCRALGKCGRSRAIRGADRARRDEILFRQKLRIAESESAKQKSNPANQVVSALLPAGAK